MIGHRDDPQLHVLITNDLVDPVHRMNGSTAPFGTDESRVGIEHADDLKIIAREMIVGQQGTTDVAGSDQDCVPGPIPSEQLLQLLVEPENLVTDSRVTELPEEGEVFADLRARETERLTKLTGVDGLPTRGDQRSNLPEIQRQTLGGGSRDLRFLIHHPSLTSRHTILIKMNIKDIIARDRTTFSFEFFPPNSDAGWSTLEKSLESLNQLNPSFVSVTYGAAGSTRERTHHLVEKLKQETTLDPAPHLTCVKHDHAEIEDILRRYARSGVSNIVVIRGDVPHGESAADAFEHFKHAADLVKLIRRFNESGEHPDPRGFGIGVAGFPEGHPETPNTLKQMDHLKAKVDAGADWICTQLFFDNNAFYDWRERCEIAGIDLPIIAGIMPITSIKGLKRMADLAGGTRFPASLIRSMQRIQDDPEAVANVGTHWATEQCRDLVDREISGIHFYTLNRSQATMSIYKTLGGLTQTTSKDPLGS